MEKRRNFNTEVDDLTKINEFFQNFETPTEEDLLRDSSIRKIQVEELESA